MWCKSFLIRVKKIEPNNFFLKKTLFFLHILLKMIIFAEIKRPKKVHLETKDIFLYIINQLLLTN